MTTSRIPHCLLYIFLFSAFSIEFWKDQNQAIAADIKNSKPQISTFPEKLDITCRNGRAKLYDQCGDQYLLFQSALEKAREERKVLLISYGAEWCIWCHVFDKYIHGERSFFKYTFGSPEDPDTEITAILLERPQRDVAAEAAALNAYVADSFVVLNLEGDFAPNGDKVLNQTGADQYFDDAIPFIFTVNSEGRFAANLDPIQVETRRDPPQDVYRGYDREKLIIELSKLYKAAQ
ncbi:DUF255 domain-containing protein [Kiloniella laminariae]|uniref:DUF255 domain-containing protein n=1 Tax=Kiloniella laminariae TaxID=454162 RepID=A0ABT4LNA5_9PROT|nr:DUF255 domain-containing protein [Kiloniella laminariae]MCZ4282622.1 DUF255 domain-containing protein [Kiloniella laminariae]